LGHLAVQIGLELGAIVTAIDVSDEKLAHAKSLGASATLNSVTVNVVKELRRAGGAHVAIVTSAAKAAYDTAFPCVRPTGTLLVVGLPSESLCFPPIMMAATEVRIQASSVGTREDLQHVLAMAAAGKIHCQTATRPLAQINEVLEQLRHGQVSGRIVLVPR
jgi:alcohol dehydrogenase, propanol-preferring